MKLLFIGGPVDGQLRDINEPLSPLVESKINVTAPNGIIYVYPVVFFSGNTLQFPVAVFETLTPDDVFKALLQWYSVKPRVRPVAPPTAAGPEPPTEPTQAEPPTESKIVLP